MDMLRKLILVGLVLLVGRGSVAQLCAAMILSFAFFSLHMKTWPYKIEQDNILRATTEAHVFIVIMVRSLLCKSNNLRSKRCLVLKRLAKISRTAGRTGSEAGPHV